ncbi:MAG: DnaD domain protein [Lachnospiraceae bacterium]|nr:DnaD domain protein [Lachnospiraceae bacterium]
MGRVSINREQPADAHSTAVSNIFIDNYMTEANDAQLKIYLWLLRMMRAGLPTSLSDLAERFNLTEKDVTRALKFWEKRGIITMEYDQDKKLSGIHLEELSQDGSETDRETATAPVPEKPAKKPAMPRQTVTEPVESTDCSQLLFIAEQYLGRPLSVADTRSLLYIRDSLHFSDALLDYLMQYCVERGKKDFRYMERVAIRWQESGYETPEQAKRGSFKYDRKLYEVMDLLGMNNLPTATEAAFIERWISTYHLPMEVIREACARTVLATQKRRLEYADRILESWHASGVSKKSDIRQLDEAHRESKKTAATAKSAQSGTGTPRQSTRTSRFPQRDDYDMALIEQVLVQN